MGAPLGPSTAGIPHCLPSSLLTLPLAHARPPPKGVRKVLVIKRVERLVNLCAYLLRPGTAASAEQIRRAIPQYHEFEGAEPFRKALQRDIRALRDIGVPVELNEHDEYYISERGYSLPVVSFSTEELYCLALARRAAEVVGPPVEEHGAAAWRKITFDQWKETQDLPDPEETVTFRPSPLAPKLDQRALEALLDALLLRKRLALQYENREGVITNRQVDPYALAAYDGQWYLVAFCHLRGEMRTFRCSRIVNLAKVSPTRPEEPDFQVPQDFRVGDYVGQVKWRLRSVHEPMEAQVRFAPETWWWVKRHWGEGQRCEDLEDGGGVLTALVTDGEAFVQCVLELGSKAEILHPPALRTAAIEALRRIVRAHSG